MMLRIVLALILGRCSVAPPSMGMPNGKPPNGWLMPHHSFEKTLTFDDNAKLWFTGGASMPLRDRVLLFPPVLERTGIIWNKDAVLTNDFELIVSFSVVGPHPTKKDSAFALWVSPDNFTATYHETEVIKSQDWKKGLAAINVD